MPNTVIPNNQEILINPYSNKIFDFDTQSSKVYVSRSVNGLLRAIGNDCILEGLECVEAVINTNNEFIVKVTPGRAICDSTLVEITSHKNSNELSMDLSSLDNSGYLVVMLSYTFLNSPHPNFSKLRLFYVNSNGRSTSPDEFEPTYDRLVLAQYHFDKTNRVLTQTASTINSLPQITIRSINYTIRPRTSLLINSYEEIKNVFTVLNYD